MNMTFSEKSAWGSLAALVLVACWYFPSAFAAASSGEHPIELVLISIGCIVALVVIEAVYHIIIAGTGRTSNDERDLLFDLKASQRSGFVLGVGLLWLVGHIIVSSIVDALPQPAPLSIAVWILLAITLSEIAKLGLQIFYYRAGG